MASREFTVKARITADTKEAERNTRALAQAEQDLGRKLDELRAKFDAGEVSAERFLRQQTRLEAQQRRLADSTAGTASGLASGAASIAKYAAAAAAGYAGVEALRRVIVASATASAEQEEAVNRLRVALADLGPEADRVVSALQAQASALQDSTTFADEEVNAAQARIAAYTTEQAAIELLTRAAADLAALRNIDLVRASDILIKAYVGEGTALKKLGVEVEGAARSTERLKSIVEGVADVAGGQAAAKLDTASGAFQRMKNAAGEVLEAIGNFGTKSDVVRASIDTLAAALFSGSDALEAFRSGSDDTADAQDRQAQASARQAAAMEEAQRLLGQVSREADRARVAFDAMAEAQSREIAESDRFLEGLGRIGVRLGSDVSEEMQRNIDLLNQSETLYRSNVITQADYIRIAQGVADANAKLAGTVGQVTERSVELTQTSPAMVTALSAQAQQAMVTARAFDELTQSAGRAAAVSAAVAGGGTLVNAGTRVRLSGGGSRLTSAPGLTGITSNYAGPSYSRTPSRFAPGQTTVI